MDKNPSDNNQNSANSSGQLFKSNAYEKVSLIQGGQPNPIESNLRGISRPMETSSHQYLPYTNYQSNQAFALPPQAPTPQLSMDSSYTSSPQQHQSFGQSHLQGVPSLKVRMRVSKACDRCRNQKIKCSGTMPCNTCVKHKKECHYSTQNSVPNNNMGNYENAPSKRIKIESPTTESNHTAQPSSNVSQNASETNHTYVTYLENRVHYLESILLKDCTTTFRPVGNKDVENNNTEVKKKLIMSSAKWRYLRRHQVLLSNKLCQTMYNNLSEENKKKVILPRKQYFGWNMSGCHYITNEKLPGLPDFKLPLDPDVYFNFFFREINSVFAILHENLFRDQVKDYEELFKSEVNLDSTERDAKTNQTRLFLAILYLVYALAIRFQEFQKKDGPSMEMLKLEEQLFKYSYKVVSLLSFEWESFELIQSWLLITLYLRISHRQTSSYLALGRAITMTRSMGLGKDNPKLLTAKPYIRLKVKRIFWCVYTMDRLFGLLSGRYGSLNDTDNISPTESFDFESEKDSWLTVPAFTLLHVARISNFVHTSVSDEFGLVKLQQINAELNRLNSWFDENGFGNKSLFDDTTQILPLVKAQVKLHYYDLINCVHGKLLFNYIGTKISNQGLKIDMVLDSCQSIIDILDQVNNAELLYTPWYQFLSLLFDTGINAITLINGGINSLVCKQVLQNSIRLITVLSEASVKNREGEVVIESRYTMAKECLWAIKMANRILSLRLEQDMKDITSYGIDPGSAEVNKQTFNQFGLNKQGAAPEENSWQQSDKKTKRLISITDRENLPGNLQAVTNVTTDSATAPNLDDPLNYVENSIDSQLSNLQWFDQWLDYNYDI
ncbi:uncharacterized protein AC631_01176 [Debaryomyces fabryi]|uniref:Zn(2)-C6 fungal-type domain-containing protein n=1 Tax=Debaryomyces fabryi TaxID=58627 RepID=A0A0V1Q3K3_9ASCO|nr:uncharacterized protein AC631_01176 [Debaryomyces fabryi]KSA03042.1 hypothetical protein AC631_01176 [Debaryomyces fabryi]CUM49182.1 unnamed protein product [Debaryomyces fabryi]